VLLSDHQIAAQAVGLANKSFDNEAKHRYFGSDNHTKITFMKTLMAHSIRRLPASDWLKYFVYPETLFSRVGCRDVRYMCEVSEC